MKEAPDAWSPRRQRFASFAKISVVQGCCLAMVSCRMHVYRVVPAASSYSLRSPEARETAFPDILRVFNGFEPGRGWMDLRPGMEVIVENAYYQPGMSRRGLEGFLGTEIARYQVPPGGGLKLLSVQPMHDRRTGQAPVQDLIAASQERHRFFRFYYEVLFRRSGESRGSVLLGADTSRELEDLARGLIADPDAACQARGDRCTVFPDACSVSIELEITVNGNARTVTWGTTLLSVAGENRRIQLWRMFKGRLRPVILNSRDEGALALPLLPGDRVVCQ